MYFPSQFLQLLVIGLAIISPGSKCLTISRKSPKDSVSTTKTGKIVGSDDEELKPLFEIDNGSKQEFGIRGDIHSKSISSSRKSKISSTDFGTSALYKLNIDLPLFQQLPQSKVVYSSEKATIEETFDSKLPSFGDFNDLAAISNVRPLSSEDVAVIPGTVIASIKLPVISPGTVIASINNNHIAPGTVITALNNNVESTKKQNAANENPTLISPFSDDIPEIKDDSEESKNKPTKTPKIRTLDENVIERLNFEPSYFGPRITLNSSITNEFIKSTLIPYFKSGKIVDKKSAYSLFYRAYQEFLVEDSLQDIELEQGEQIIIFGDIHGQFPDFITVFEKEGYPTDKLKYLFNGDIVDRGAYSIECLLTLLAFKIAQPDNFYVSLGNHETPSVGKLQFHKESVKKYGNEEFFRLAHSLFKSFPVAYLIQDEVFVTHGGISPLITLEKIRKVDRIDPDSDDEAVIDDLIWSDPVALNGTAKSNRGLGVYFGHDITHNFLIQNNISAIIRSHQFKEFGFSEQHGGSCITIFSCPNYRGKMPNYGAFIKLDHTLNLKYNLFIAAEPLKNYATIPKNLSLGRNIRRIR